MIEDDGDEIRGLGFSTLHAAYLEGVIHDLLVMLSPVQNYTEEEQRWAIARKIKVARQRIKKLSNANFDELYETLAQCKDHFDWRNEILHSLIYSPEYVKDNLVSTRPGVPARRLEAKELYDFANNFNSLRLSVQLPMKSDLPKAIALYEQSKA